MSPRILILGDVPPGLRHELAGLGVDLMDAAGEPGAEDFLAGAPDLLVLGGGADRVAERVAHQADIPVPVLSCGIACDADLTWPGDATEQATVIRSALRLALLHSMAASPESAAFRSRLGQEFARALRYRHPLSVVVLALDRPERLLREHGPEAMDGFVRALLASLVRSLRGSDALFRTGEHEITAILPDTAASGALVVAERLRIRTRNLVYKAAAGSERPSLPLKATPSVGVADGPGEGVHGVDDLIARAHTAAGAAQDQGGDRVRVHAGVSRTL